MLRCPSGSLEIIQRRHEDLSFFCNNSRTELCLQLSSSIKKIKNYHRLMRKLAANTMNVNDWVAVSRTLHGIVEVSYLAQGCRFEDVTVLQNILCHVDDNIFNLRSIFDQLVDLKMSKEKGQVSVKPGVDVQLDEKRRLYNGMSDLLNRISSEEKKYVPPGVRNCTAVYLPHIGFLVAVPRESLENPDMNVLSDHGYEYVFESATSHHFRTTRTRSMDAKFGDVMLEIIKREAAIITRLTEIILKKRTSLEAIVTYCAQLDCLISMSQVCREQNWVKPEMVQAGDLIIRDGRHPLQELAINNFIPNDTWMGRKGGRVHVLTGPNSSGKSVYMKQVGLIIYLAHLGCFVPASAAKIPIFERIFIRVNTSESVGQGMSSFMSDLNHLTSALTNMQPATLLLVDEFGKGTAACDGASLLAATISHLGQLRDKSPLAVFSTHFHQVPDLAEPSTSVQFLYMNSQLSPASDLVHYYKLTEGVCSFSHALEVAKKAGIERSVVERGRDVLTSLQNGSSISLNSDHQEKMKSITDFMSQFLDLDVDDDDKLTDFLSHIDNLDI